MLGQDGDPGAQDVRLGLAAADLHGGVVDRDDLVDEGREAGERAHLIVDDVVVGEGDIARRECDAVLPLDSGAQVEGPHLAVRRDLPRLGQVRDRLQIEAVADEEVVVEHPDLVGRGLGPDERVEVVRVVRPADPQDDLPVRRRAGVGGERPAESPDEAREQEHAHDQGQQPEMAPTAAHGTGRGDGTRHEVHPSPFPRTAPGRRRRDGRSRPGAGRGVLRATAGDDGRRAVPGPIGGSRPSILRCSRPAKRGRPGAPEGRPAGRRTAGAAAWSANPSWSPSSMAPARHALLAERRREALVVHVPLVLRVHLEQAARELVGRHQGDVVVGAELLGHVHAALGVALVALQLPGAEQFQRDDRCERGLCDDHLRAVLLHALLVVGDLVQVDLADHAVLLAAHPGAGRRLAHVLLADLVGVGRGGRDDVARRHLDALHLDRRLSCRC